ncbi:MAG: hypothetical protein WDN76_07900 [Alphaproteobacteria bacterium]
MSSLFNTEDSSALINARATWLFTHHTAATIGVTGYAGDKRSEFGVLPFSSNAYVSLSQPF